jgi:OOP family OmpA-OmpF porin
MKTLRMMLVLAAMIGLSACATPWQVAEVQDIKTTVATGGTAFTAALLEEYKQQARIESEVEIEWRHAVTYARKGARAATGEMVMPEDPNTWSVPASALDSLVAARARLLEQFDKGARERLPAVAAKAQAAYDCWLEEEWERDADPGCRATFEAALAELTPAPMAAPAAAPARNFKVFFDFDKSGITSEAKAVLAEVAKAQADSKAPVIHISGFTDTVGSRRYNHKLSIKRAQNVAQALTKLGIGEAKLDVKGYGKEKDRLAVPTKDNVKEAKNRRVEIVFGGEPRPMAGTLTTPAPAPAPAISAPAKTPGGSNGVLGMLMCAKSGSGTTYVLFSRIPVECRYEGIGGVQKYTGTSGILLGVDLEIEPSAGMGYLVMGVTSDDKASVEGKYVGAKASATFGIGPAVQGGLAGIGNGVTLVPFGLGGQTGIGATAGLSYLDIQAVR